MTRTNKQQSHDAENVFNLLKSKKQLRKHLEAILTGLTRILNVHFLLFFCIILASFGTLEIGLF